MKCTLLTFVFLFTLQMSSFTQITFEEITPPDDLNINTVRKSPIGEYFLQTSNDTDHMYHSSNGQNWTEIQLPHPLRLSEVQFFSDGAPLLKPEDRGHVIRRNGLWYKVNYTGGWSDVEASFIKSDTLFVYQDNAFGYSLNKGQNFTPLFTATETIIDHTSNLWVFDQNLILHHSAGATDMVSVFNRRGELLSHRELQIVSPNFVFTDCGEVLIYDHNDYYLIKEDGQVFEHGITAFIFPDFSHSSRILGQGDAYYLIEEEQMYKSNCSAFDWELLIGHEVLEFSNDVWITDTEEVFASDDQRDHYLTWSPTNNWQSFFPLINYAWVNLVDESPEEQQQLALTTNALFRKSINEAAWEELSLDGVDIDFQMAYAPNGDLYINTGTAILFSNDDGSNFSRIEYPDPGPFGIPSYHMEILDDRLLILVDRGLGTSYYSSNRGGSWTEADNLSFLISSEAPLVKRVGNTILIADLGLNRRVTKIDLATGFSSVEGVGNFFDTSNRKATIADNGTIFFHASDFSGTGNTGIFRFRFGEGTTFVGDPSNAAVHQLISTESDDLLIMSWNNYFRLNGTDFESYDYINLPSNFNKRFLLSENEYLYAIMDNHRIFHSTKPLSEKQKISGAVYRDTDLDCRADSSDLKLKFWQIKVENDNYLRIRSTNDVGEYRFSVPLGDYTVSCRPASGDWELCEPAYDVSLNTAGATVVRDFQAQPLADCANLEIDFSTPRLRRCFDNYYNITVRNTGPVSSVATTLTIELDPFFEYTSATLPPTNIDQQTLTFELGALEMGDQVSFRIYFVLSCDAELSMEHCLSGYLQDEKLCGATLRSSYTECQENIGSYDPNDKRTFDDRGNEVSTIDKDEYIYYHIRFQNTGTDTAFNVRVVDPLSPILDLNTFEMLSASHPYEYRITDGPELEVKFNDILLPDSTINEPASNGYFKFRVKPHLDYDYGTMIPNEAGIYFDFNEPIITNEAVILLERPSSTTEVTTINVDLFPNPTRDQLQLKIASNDMTKVQTIEVTNELGQLMDRVEDWPKNTMIYSTSKLVAGLYVITLKDHEGKVIGRKKFTKVN